MNYLSAKLLGLVNNLEKVKNPTIKIEFITDNTKLKYYKTFFSFYSAIRYITENPQLTYNIIEGEEHMEKHHNEMELGGEA